MSGSAEYCPLVGLQNLQPVIEVAGMILAKLGRQFETGA
jgi:hypothetical protein